MLWRSSLAVAYLGVCALLWPGLAGAFSFVATSAVDASSDGSALNTVTCAKPTGTADNDIMFSFVKQPNTETITAPSGWSTSPFPLIDSDATFAGRYILYYKVAASEGTSYAWSWTTTGRSGCSIYTFRDDFNTSSPIDATSNTSYETSNTTARAASMTTSAANEVIVLFGAETHALGGASNECTAQPTSPTTFTEHADVYNGNSRFGRCAASATWTGSGSTGDMDITIAQTVAAKHAFAVALNPATGAINVFRARLRSDE